MHTNLYFGNLLVTKLLKLYFLVLKKSAESEPDHELDFKFYSHEFVNSENDNMYLYICGLTSSLVSLQSFSGDVLNKFTDYNNECLEQ